MSTKNNDAKQNGSQENIKVAARGVMPPARIIDPAQCNGCPALKICSVIVPGGPWNPAPGNGVKACPGVRT